VLASNADAEQIAQEIVTALEPQTSGPRIGMEYLIYIPGIFKCTECGFVLSKATISASTMQIGLTEKNLEPEPCPNDGTMLVKMTWKENAEELQQRCSEEMAGNAACRDALERVKLESFEAGFRRGIKKQATAQGDALDRLEKRIEPAIKRGIERWRVSGSLPIQDEGYLRVVISEEVLALIREERSRT